MLVIKHNTTLSTPHVSTLCLCLLHPHPQTPFLPYRASCSHLRLSHSTTAYSNIQESYETKGPGPEWPSVKDYFSDKFSNNKASIVPRQALELAAGAAVRLTGLDSRNTLPDLSGGSVWSLWFTPPGKWVKSERKWRTRQTKRHWICLWTGFNLSMDLTWTPVGRSNSLSSCSCFGGRRLFISISYQ